MKYRLITILILFGLVGVTAPADEIPQFYKDTLPEHAAAKMLEGWGVVQGEGAAPMPIRPKPENWARPRRRYARRSQRPAISGFGAPF